MSGLASVFRDRTEAGRLLAERLAGRGLVDPVVYALPRGGAPVAVEIARALKAPLDLLLVRKIGAPGQPEQEVGDEAPDPVFRAQGVASLRDEFRKLVGDMGYGQALAVWTALHPDQLAYTIGTTDRITPSRIMPLRCRPQ